MAKVLIEGKELEFGEHLTIGEICDAEKALGMDMGEGMGPKMAVMMFAALRKDEPATPPAILANRVRAMDITAMGAVTDESPPAVAADAAETNGTDPTPPLTTGPLPSGIGSGFDPETSEN